MMKGSEMSEKCPWALQKMLMDSAALEPSPTQYQIDKLSILYTALILEETAELTAGMAKILSRLTDEGKATIIPSDSSYDEKWKQVTNKEKLASLMAILDDFLTETSLEIRDILKETKDFTEILNEDEVVEIADACTDISVVNCGFAVSSGIPGADCYEEVLGSNLSKRDPASGKILKDNSGKWLRGPSYVPPNLKKILFP